MMLADDYLAIPKTFGTWLGGLRWSLNGDAIEFLADGSQIGLTYAMGVEIARFLEGLSAGGTFHHFGHVLQMLDVLGYGLRRRDRQEGIGSQEFDDPSTPRYEIEDSTIHHGGPFHFPVPVRPSRRPSRFQGLAKAFRESGWPLRNAGALFAMLCDGFPNLPDPPSMNAVVFRLSDRSLARYARVGRDSVMEPPFTPDTFEALLAEELGRLSEEELRHWLKHGRGPVKGEGEKVAQALPPPTAAEVLAAVESRPRLKGSRALVARLAGALALPPRRLAAAELPVGGYTDVATRGLPEQILPFQFALDPDEFLRRFAERELLYFHREEPRAPAARQLLLVLDQGVRTWGDIRLVLASATLALARQADRNGQEIRFAATSDDGPSLDPAAAGIEALGALLDASDLTANPGATLARVLVEKTQGPRDVVLLTHPRNLDEPEVISAARDTSPSTRLFAVSVSPKGEVELSVLRHGHPVAIGRCRVEIGECPGPDESRPSSPHVHPHVIVGTWHGDVEPVPFPFLVGPTDSIEDHLFTFDDSGDWLLLADRFGLLRLWRSDGTKGEMPPRSHSSKGGLLNSVEAVVGVSGGFVVIGINGSRRFAAHYDVNARLCESYEITSIQRQRLSWTYLRKYHTVIGHEGAVVWTGLDLGGEQPGIVFPTLEPQLARTRETLQEWNRVPLLLPVLSESQPKPETGRAVMLDNEGRLHIRAEPEGWRSFIPVSDGEPRLKGCTLIQARWQGVILAILVTHRDGRRELLVFSVWGEWRVIGEFRPERSVDDFAMTRDGRRLAWRSGFREILVRDLEHIMPPTLVITKGRAHSSLDISLGAGFLVVEAGRYAHLIRWDSDRLEMTHTESPASAFLAKLGGKFGRPSVWHASAWPGSVTPYWRSRFFAAAIKSGLSAAVDRIGEVAMFGWSGELVCMFFFFRHQVAAWMPDGTRLGPVSLIGGPETPRAAERIGRALRDASGNSRLAAGSQPTERSES